MGVGQNGFEQGKSVMWSGQKGSEQQKGSDEGVGQNGFDQYDKAHKEIG